MGRSLAGKTYFTPPSHPSQVGASPSGNGSLRINNPRPYSSLPPRCAPVLLCPPRPLPAPASPYTAPRTARSARSIHIPPAPRAGNSPTCPPAWRRSPAIPASPRATPPRLPPAPAIPSLPAAPPLKCLPPRTPPPASRRPSPPASYSGDYRPATAAQTHPPRYTPTTVAGRPPATAHERWEAAEFQAPVPTPATTGTFSPQPRFPQAPPSAGQSPFAACESHTTQTARPWHLAVSPELRAPLRDFAAGTLPYPSRMV